LLKFLLPEEPKRDGGGSPTEELGSDDAVQHNNHTNGGSGDGSLDEEDDDWAPVDETTTKLDGKLSSAMGKLVIDSDMDKPLQDRLDMLHEFFVNAKKDGSIYVSFSFLSFFLFVWLIVSIVAGLEEDGQRGRATGVEDEGSPPAGERALRRRRGGPDQEQPSAPDSLL